MNNFKISVLGLPPLEDTQVKLSDLMPQIIKISQFYVEEGFFVEETVSRAIPADAQDNLCLVGLLPGGKVAGFCIAKTSYYEVEILWLATHPMHLKKGCASQLLRRLEHISKKYFPKARSIYVKLAAPNCMMGQEKKATARWSETSNFVTVHST